MTIPGHGRSTLILAGGNALGAYHAGAIEALQDFGVNPTRIIGTSIGAITGAIIAGNSQDKRVDRLRAFWRLAEQPQGASSAGAALFGNEMPSRWEGLTSGVGALLFGRPRLFGPNAGVATILTGDRAKSIHDARPLAGSLRDFVDFEYLARSPTQLLVMAVDCATGEEVVFDNTSHLITEPHLLASSAMPILFEPVEIGGRMLVDGGMSANLPLRQAFDPFSDQPELYIAIDLFRSQGCAPNSIAAAAQRAQDLMFSSQSRHALEELERMVKARAGTESSQYVQVDLLYISYRGDAETNPLMALDFSKNALRSRWEAGKTDMSQALRTYWDSERRGRPGLQIFSFGGSGCS
jgi:NTE family protein